MCVSICVSIIVLKGKKKINQTNSTEKTNPSQLLRALVEITLIIYLANRSPMHMDAARGFYTIWLTRGGQKVQLSLACSLLPRKRITDSSRRWMNRAVDGIGRPLISGLTAKLGG